jgi:hypothetical protein
VIQIPLVRFADLAGQLAWQAVRELNDALVVQRFSREGAGAGAGAGRAVVRVNKRRRGVVGSMIVGVGVAWCGEVEVEVWNTCKSG